MQFYVTPRSKLAPGIPSKQPILVFRLEIARFQAANRSNRVGHAQIEQFRSRSRIGAAAHTFQMLVLCVLIVCFFLNLFSLC